MLAIYKREMQAYFKTPIGYIFVGMFLVVSGFLFITYNLMMGYPSISSILYSLITVFMFLIPVLTMRLLSEEKNLKTDQVLLTAPISVGKIVLGKFFAAATVYLLTLVLTLIYMVVIGKHGEPQFAQTFCNYFGFALLGMAFISIGVFISSLTENQAVAAVCTFAVLLVLFLFNSVKNSVQSKLLSAVFDAIAISSRFDSFNLGVLSIAPVVYYISVTALFLFFTTQVIERRRWR